jgi:hypothetical protein
MTHGTKRTKSRRTAAETLAVILEHVADADADIAEADLAPSSEADRQWALEQHAKMQFRIAAMRRLHTPSHPAIERAPPASASIRALSRAELLAQLEQLSQGGAVQFAHRSLTGLTDDDLRQLLAVLVQATEE